MSSRLPPLSQIILGDLMHYKLVLLMGVMVVMSALGIVYMSHTQRNLVAQVEQLRMEQDQLDVEWRHLILEQNALSEHSRIQEQAREQLKMHRPGPNDEVIVELP